MKIQNMPEYAKSYRFVVAREEKGQLWFYGAYHELSKAKSVADEVFGIIVRQYLDGE